MRISEKIDVASFVLRCVLLLMLFCVIGTDSCPTVSSNECALDEDCHLVMNCCFCRAVPYGEEDQIPDCPDIQCFASACDAQGVDSASCNHGKCVKGF